MRLEPTLVLIVSGLAGCAGVPLPANVASISLVAVSSYAIEVYRPRFRVDGDTLELEGYVYRQHRADTTADSHIDIVFVDPAGRVLAVDTTNFSPRSLPTSIRGPKPHAYFRVVISRLPSGTRAIEVRGHDGPHEARPNVQS